MDMDPVTRREAEKVEEVLRDLVTDLEMISYLPDEFSMWLRDNIVPTVESAGPRLQKLLSAGEEEDDELQRLVKACCFVHAAGHYGDPADCINNEAVVQISEFSEVERDLLETATTVGHVDPDDLEFHHLSLRALLDTMREGQYDLKMREYLTSYFPPLSPPSSPGLYSQSITSELTIEQDKEEFNKDEACASGMITTGIDDFRHVVHVLHKLMELRNASTVNEDIHRYKVLHEAVNKEQSATADVQALNREYEEVKAARRREVAEMDDEIAKLEEELDYVRHAADIELEAFYEVSEKIQGDHRSLYRQQLEQHRQAADALASKMARTQLQHMDEMNQLRSLRAKKEAAVSGAIVEYDTQMSNMQAAIDKLQKEAEEDTEVIVGLEERLEKLHREKTEYELEQRIAEQRQEHLDAIRQRQEQSARVLQAYFRAFLSRVHGEREMNKKKGKKKKGGRKKSGK